MSIAEEHRKCEIDIKYETFRQRLARGWSLKKASTFPVEGAKAHKPPKDHPYRNAREFHNAKNQVLADKKERSAPICCKTGMSYIPSEDRYVCTKCHKYSAPYRPSGDRRKPIDRYTRTVL